jgi:hypothetical protein
MTEMNFCRYLRLKYDVHWSELMNLQEPLRVGDVLILPVMGFSREGRPSEETDISGR